MIGQSWDFLMFRITLVTHVVVATKAVDGCQNITSITVVTFV